MGKLIHGKADFNRQKVSIEPVMFKLENKTTTKSEIEKAIGTEYNFEIKDKV